tara:strand:+ start:110 stop:475 length:366 start_codon:yes stop_codon:yes gene_type:complete
MATYAWSIQRLYTKDITESGTTYADVIIRVNATLTGTSETINSITGEGTFDLDMNVTGLASGFTAYNSVTEANVKSWVEGRIDSTILSNIKSEIEGHIDFEEKVHGSTAKEDSEGNATFPW